MASSWIEDGLELSDGGADFSRGSCGVALPPPTGGGAGKRSKKSKHSGADEDAPEVTIGRKKPSFTYAMKSCAKVSGRRCSCCNSTDQEGDPVCPKDRRLWAVYRRVKGTTSDPPDLETDGATCWYCFRV